MTIVIIVAVAIVVLLFVTALMLELARRVDRYEDSLSESDVAEHSRPWGSVSRLDDYRPPFDQERYQ